MRYLKKSIPEAIIFFIVLSAFIPSLFNSFVGYDDPGMFLNIEQLKTFSIENIKWIFSHRILNHYHPLTAFSFALDYAIWGENLFGFHLTSVLLHCLSSSLLFMILKRMLCRFFDRPKTVIISASIIGALFFAVNPMRVESVSWLSERKDVLCAFFYFLSLLLFFCFRESGKYKYLLLCFFSFVMGCLSKSMMASFPFVCLLLDIFIFSRLPLNFLRWLKKENRIYLTELIPFLCIFIAVSVQVLIFPPEESLSYPFVPSVNKVFYAFAMYPLMNIFPYNLSYIYAPVPQDIFFAFKYAVLCAVMASPFIFWGRKNRLAAFAVLFYIIALLPVCGLLNGAPSPVNDRYCYIPSVSFSIISCALYIFAADRLGVKAASLIFGMAISLFLPACVMQQRIWKDSYSLFSICAERQPKAAAVHYNLGTYLYMHAKDKKYAFDEFEKAVKLGQDQPGLLVNVADYYYKEQMFQEAYFLSYSAYKLRPNTAAAWKAMGKSLLAMGMHEEAEKTMIGAHNIWSKNPYFTYALAEFYIFKRDIAKAEFFAGKTLNLLDGDLDSAALSMVCGLKMLEGNKEEAEEYCRKAVQADKANKLAETRLAELSK